MQKGTMVVVAMAVVVIVLFAFGLGWFVKPAPIAEVVVPTDEELLLGKGIGGKAVEILMNLPREPITITDSGFVVFNRKFFWTLFDSTGQLKFGAYYSVPDSLERIIFVDDIPKIARDTTVKDTVEADSITE